MSNIELPKFTIKQLLEAGVHFGHKTMRRNPKMSRYIHTSRNGVSIIDLNKTANLLLQSLKTVKEITKNNGRILFVATKKQAVDPIAEAAKRCGQYYVNFRWLGGMLTNWKTVSQSIKTLKKIEEQLSDTEIGFNKKEKLVLERQRMKLERALGGIKNIGGYPDLLFVIDTYKESLAIAEAKKLGIPIMAIVDSNSNPDGITFPIPGNDDSAKSIKLYCRLISDAAIAGTKENMVAAGMDISKLNEKSFESVVKTPIIVAQNDSVKVVGDVLPQATVESGEDKPEARSKREIFRKSERSEDGRTAESPADKTGRKPGVGKVSDKRPTRPVGQGVAGKKPAAKK